MANHALLGIKDYVFSSSQMYPSVAFMVWSSGGTVLSNGTFSNDYGPAITSTMIPEDVSHRIIDAFVSYMASVPVITVDRQDVKIL